ncbi:MAG: hypothetical protein Q8R01_15465 [Ramlibacter sp.]|nr:hypothetical protein [Ramlibacter sp.]
MKRLSAKSLATVAVVLGAFAAASAAHARSDVIFSIGVQSPGYGYGYVQPAPVYVEPAPVYVAPPGYYAPRPVYVQPQVSYYGHTRYDRRYDGRYERRWGPNGDLDRDGIRNRDDRDVDGDGIRNRRDHFPADRYRY